MGIAGYCVDKICLKIQEDNEGNEGTKGNVGNVGNVGNKGNAGNVGNVGKEENKKDDPELKDLKIQVTSCKIIYECNERKKNARLPNKQKKKMTNSLLNLIKNLLN